MNDDAQEGPATGLEGIPASRWRAMGGFPLVGLCAIVMGGLVAAATGPTGLPGGSWVAAYLVLVAGVAQVGLGAGQALLARVAPSERRRAWQLALYNVGNIAVLGGTLIESVTVVAVGGLLLLLALALFLASVRHSAAHSWYLAVYRTLLIILGPSVLVGVGLSILRHN